MGNLAEGIFVAAVRAELDRVNNPQVRIAAQIADLKLSIDAPGLAEFALECERLYRKTEREVTARLHGPLPEPRGADRG